jgi:type II secretory pathway pseudopilin PulG
MNARKLNSQSGLTLVEIVLAMAVFAFVSITAYQLMNIVQKDTLRTREAIDANLESLVSQRLLTSDIIASSPSFNCVKLPDDNGRNFFDYLSDGNCTDPTLCPRILSLSPPGRGGVQQVVFMTSAGDLSPALIYAPHFAYNVQKAVTLDAPGILTYVGVNRDKNLEKIIDPLNYPKFWDPKENPRLLFFYSSTAVRPSSGTVNLSIPARSSVYLGVLNYTMKPVLSNVLMTAAPLSAYVDVSHPSQAGLTMTDTVDIWGTNGFDRFLRTLPPVGGVGATAFFRPARMIRYSFVTETGSSKTTYALYRDEWNPKTNAFEKPLMMGREFYGIVFKRKTISSPVIDTYVTEKKLDYDAARKP